MVTAPAWHGAAATSSEAAGQPAPGPRSPPDSCATPCQGERDLPDDALPLKEPAPPGSALPGGTARHRRGYCYAVQDIAEHFDRTDRQNVPGDQQNTILAQGAVVGQQPFGGARASGTDDKASSIFNASHLPAPGHRVQRRLFLVRVGRRAEQVAELVHQAAQVRALGHDLAVLTGNHEIMAKSADLCGLMD